MPKQLSEEIREIYHYTTITGLKGIIESQTLWATHYAYLNDAEEIRHFGARLKVILDPVIDNVLKKFRTVKPGEFRDLIEKQGGFDKLKEDEIKTLARIMYDLLLGNDKYPPIAEPYISSFCAATNSKEQEHGLLSQWRGYGSDGGYAIVFDTKKIEDLLGREAERWQYGFLQGGDVLYSNAADEKIEEEIGEHIDEIKRSVGEFYEVIMNRGAGGREAAVEALEKIYPAILFCSCRYKHWGFAEEKEVRIVAIPQSPVVRKMAEAQPIPLLPEKPKKHFLRRGMAVPYIELFEGLSNSAKTPLPITRILVGPHAEKDKRKKAVDLLLQQHGIEVPVSNSEIPYLG